jgi:ABC-2 type transport system ATP-binding protein
VALGSPAELKKQIAGDIITLGYDSESDVAAASALLRGQPLILESQQPGLLLLLYVDRGDEALPEIMRILGQGRRPPKTIHLSRPSLDDVFLKLTGRTLHKSADVP